MAAMQAQRQSQNTTEAEDETFGPMLLARLEVVIPPAFMPRGI